MVKRLEASDNPNLFLLSYSLQPAQVTNFDIIPKHFLVPSLIEKRPPLAPTARRAGWIGCNILLQDIPRSGCIGVIEAGVFRSKSDVLADWRKVLFVRESRHPEARGWLIHVMTCIESLGRNAFSLRDIYQFEDALKQVYPENQHIRPKLRQQLQRLRDVGYLDFEGKGTYTLRRGARLTSIS